MVLICSTDRRACVAVINRESCTRVVAQSRSPLQERHGSEQRPMGAALGVKSPSDSSVDNVLVKETQPSQTSQIERSSRVACFHVRDDRSSLTPDHPSRVTHAHGRAGPHTHYALHRVHSCTPRCVRPVAVLRARAVGEDAPSHSHQAGANCNTTAACCGSLEFRQAASALHCL
eukprot:COSAG02_NODE_5237_length_4513_cov_7.143860_3_plen_174_part_00